MGKRVAILGGFDYSLVNFRGPLIRALSSAKHEVIAIAPPESSVANQIAELGARFVPIRLSRSGLNPIVDLQTRSELCRVFAQEQIDVLVAYSIKPVVHGLPMARKAGVKERYALITGLGAAFHTGGFKGRVLELMATLLYRKALCNASGVMVQNGDIAKFLQQRRMIGPDVPLNVIPGSGVDLARYLFTPLPPGPPTYLMLSRLLRDKGVEEFVAAARLVKYRIPNAIFRVVGPHDGNPSGIHAESLRRWQHEGVVDFLPQVNDVRPLLASSHVGVLPSYHEGLPRSLLEFMGTGRPIITTDVIGCRETVPDAGPADAFKIRQGSNGFLVPVRTTHPLAAAMIRLALEPSLASTMGRAGRNLVENRFEVSAVNQAMLRAMGLAEVSGALP